MTGIQPIDLSNVQKVVDKLLTKGCNAIILTLGPLGAVYASKTNRNVTRIPTTEVHPVDTTVCIAYTQCRRTIVVAEILHADLEFIRLDEIRDFFKKHFLNIIIC